MISGAPPTFEAHCEKTKRARIQIEKALVGINVSLRFMADLLVGAFGFVLALLFAKYVLIMRPGPETADEAWSRWWARAGRASLSCRWWR